MQLINAATNTTTNDISKYGLYIDSTGDFSGAGGGNTLNYGLYVAAPSGADQNYAAVFAGGNVGIGTSTPVNLLSVNGQGSFGGIAANAGFEPIEAQGAFAGISLHDRTGGSAERWVIYSDEVFGAGTQRLRFWTGSDKMSIASNGDVNITGKLTAVGGFNGQCLSSGTFATSGANACNMDLAEGFASVERTEPGDLVSLVAQGKSDPAVQKSTRAYESLLAGVVSANPGLVFEDGRTHLSGDNSQLISKDRTVVALAGRVLTKVSMENGPVAVGDPITSSSAPGLGMKATKTGKIVGYALEAADKNRTILVLVQPGYYVAPEGNALSASAAENLDRKGVDVKSDDARLTALLIEAVKEQQAEIRELKSQVGKLSARLSERTELARR